MQNLLALVTTSLRALYGRALASHFARRRDFELPNYLATSYLSTSELDFSIWLGETVSTIWLYNAIAMKRLCGLLFFLTFSGAIQAGVNCDDLVGIWSNERQDITLSSERRTVAVLESDGSISIKFIYDDGKDIIIREEFGNWSCEGSTLSIAITLYGNKPAYNFSQYKLLELSNTYQKMSGINSNCAASMGDCGDHIIYEYFRVLN